MPINESWKHALWVVPLTAAIAMPAMAQAPAAGTAAVLDEVVVTARKREENLLTVPLAITAITEAQIEREGIKDVEGIIARDPSLNFDGGFVPFDTRIVIRGLSPTRGRPNVATLVDGIDVSSEAINTAGGSLLINPRLIDVKQIEVVKGPQSALFGRSAFSGAVSYTTLDPDREVSGGFGVDFSNRDQTELKANLSLPLSDTLGVRVSGYSFGDDGFYRNSADNSLVGGGSGLGGALTVKWTPNETYSLKFRSEYSDDAFDQSAQALLAFTGVLPVPASASICNIGTTAAGQPTSIGVVNASCLSNATTQALGLTRIADFERLTGNRGVWDDMTVPYRPGGVGDAKGLSASFSPDYFSSTDNGATAPPFSGTDRQVLRFSATQALDFAFGTFTSLTGYTRALTSTNYDIDKGNGTSVQQRFTTSGITEQFSQELRFTSDFDGPVNFIGGAQYWTERADQFESSLTVVGAGTSCVAFDAPGPAPTVESPPNPMFGVAAGSCTPPTGGFTGTNVTQFVDDLAARRVPGLARRLIRHTSAYLDIEWQVVDQLKLVAEARYIDEDNSLFAGFTDGQNGPGTIILCSSATLRPCTPTGSGITSLALPPITQYIQYPVINDSYVTPKGTLQWTPRENLNLYASYSLGKKPGGYTSTTITGAGAPPLSRIKEIAFEPEQLKVYELGAKWASADRRISLTGAIFHTDFTDKQVGTQLLVGTALVNSVTNAGAATLQGIELAAQFRPNDRWSFGGGLTYFSDYQYDDYKIVSRSASDAARGGNCTIGFLDDAERFVALGSSPVPFLTGSTTALRTLTCQVDRSGNKLEDTAKLAMAFNVGYRRPVGGAGNTFFAEVDGNWQDERFLEDDNLSYLDSYWLANLRLGIEGERWTAMIYADNVSDDRTIRAAGTGPAIAQADFRFGLYQFFPPGAVAPASVVTAAPFIANGTFVNLPRPRTVGLRFNYKF